MTRSKESGEGGVVGWVQGVGMLDRVTTSSVGWWSTFFMASGGQEEPLFQFGLGCVMSHHQSPH